MTPGADDLCVFALKRGDATKRFDAAYGLKGKTVSLTTEFPVIKLGSAIDDIYRYPTFYGIDYTTGGVRVLKGENITREGEWTKLGELRCIDPGLSQKYSRTILKANDLVMTVRGEVGKVGMVDEALAGCNMSTNVIKISLKQEVHGRKIYPRYIWQYLNSGIGKALIRKQVAGGVQETITVSDIADIDIVLPEYPMQVDIVKRMDDLRNSKNLKLRQADELRCEFERKLAEQCGIQGRSSPKLCYAIRLNSLDGVIDAKRYRTGPINSPYTVSDVCEIAAEKISPSVFDGQTINWIRIDDLPSRPLDIETIRTQPANMVEGSFFKVQNGDILVARLGPTILNQKIVMVRDVGGETIASAEFLVLRCKAGYEAEAVMAVLKTPYFCDLMYSHARGSTPSRYRLSREDMLKLPFPDIRDPQKEIADEAVSVRLLVKKLRSDAWREWQAAKARFEKELLGGREWEELTR